MSLLNALNLKQRDVWLVRIYFFLFFAGSAFLRPFLSLFFDRQGLSGTQIGFMGMIAASTQLVAAPLWGHASDNVPRPRRLLQIALLGSALMMSILSQQTLFVWMAIVISLDALLTGGLLPLSDTLALGISRGKNYGSIRLWGSLGWAGIILIAGWLIQQADILVAFVGYAISLALCAGVLLLISPESAQRGQIRQGSGTKRRLAVLREGLLDDTRITGISAALIVLLFFRLGIASFEPIYLDRLGAPESVIGLGGTIAALVELPAMLWADQLKKRIGSRRLFMASNGIYMGMMSAVLLAPSITTIILTKIAAGFGLGFYLVSLVNFVHESVPERLRSTGLALFTVTLPALTKIVANPLNGFLFDALGTYWLYAFALGGYIVSTLMLWLIGPDQYKTSSA